MEATFKSLSSTPCLPARPHAPKASQPAKTAPAVEDQVSLWESFIFLPKPIMLRQEDCKFWDQPGLDSNTLPQNKHFFLIKHM